MNRIVLNLYKIKWRNTANTYVVANSLLPNNEEKIKEAVRKDDNRCDDIVSIEKVGLPSFDGDNMRHTSYVNLFMQTDIL